MARHSFSQLDPKRWFDRMLPQTLQVALWLLYIDGAYAILDLLDRTNAIGYLRSRGGLFVLLSLAACISYVAGGFLIANGRRLGWYLGIGASLSPIVLRFLMAFDLHSTYNASMTLRSEIFGNSMISFAFEAALVALLLHPQSRYHAKTWLR
jgi:hypothetical protein